MHERVEGVKHSPEAMMTSVLAEGIGHLAAVEQPLVDFFRGKAIGVTTNVAGPRERRYLAGSEVTSVLGWVPDPERLVELVDAELDALVGATR